MSCHHGKLDGCAVCEEIAWLKRDLAALREENDLPARVLTMCSQRGWSLHWTHRGAYLHLEASELIEAIRGKHGDPLEEAADVLLVLMSITEYHGIPWRDVVAQAGKKVDAMMVRPRYAGEEFDAALAAKEPRIGS